FLRAKKTQPSLFVALGLHRPMSAEELAPLVRLSADFGVPLTQHRAADPAVLTTAGAPIPAFEDGTRPLIPRRSARTQAGTDLIFGTGIVEPHQYARYSGGAKIVAIGCAGAETIAGMHGPHYLRDPRTRLGAVEDNPFQRALPRLVVELPELFALQIVPE